MNKLVIMMALSVLASGKVAAQDTIPFVKQTLMSAYPNIFDVASRDFKVDPDLTYKLLLLSNWAEKDSTEQIYSWEARAVSMHYEGGVPKEHLKIVLLIGSEGLYGLLTEEAYKKRYGVSNPNLKTLDEFLALGAIICADGVGLEAQHIDKKNLYKGIKVVSSIEAMQTYYYEQGYR